MSTPSGWRRHYVRCARGCRRDTIIRTADTAAEATRKPCPSCGGPVVVPDPKDLRRA